MIIKMLENEYWWGGIVNLGGQMPYSEESDLECDVTTIKLSLDQCAPVFVSSKGRYITSDKPFKATFWHGEIRISDKYSVSLEKSGDTLKSAALALGKDYFKFDGKMPNELFFKVPQYNTWIELGENQTQDGIIAYAEKIVENGMSKGVFMIDAGWQNGLGDWTFDLNKIPDPKGMVERLHELGFKVMLWTAPIIRKTVAAYDGLCNDGMLVKNADGEIAVRWWWGGNDPVIDLTNKAALKWYTDRLDSLMQNYGVDGFKLDAGDIYFYDDGDRLKNPCTAQEQTKLFNLLGLKYEFHEFRAGYNCGGLPIVFRLQDKTHTWNGEGINCIIPNSVIQGLIGHVYHCPDMVGGGSLSELFDTSFEQELYVRWAQANALCPMMQFSIAPWRVLSAENFEIVKKTDALHAAMGGYITQLAHHAAETGEPIMRHMAYEFPNEGFETVNDQFMLGDKYLVAPVLEKGKTARSVKLPCGKWTDERGNEYEGGTTVKVDAPLDTLKYFVKNS